MFDFVLLEYRTNIQDVLVFIVCAGALIWGGGPERAVAATWLIVFELAGAIQDWFFGKSVQLAGVDWFFASADAVAGLIFILIALYANRNYTLWIAGMQVLAIMAHLARSLADLISPITYAVMFVAPGWFQLMLLGVGLARHIQRRRKYGTYRDWRISKPAIGLTAVPAAQSGGTGWQQKGQPSWRDELK